MDPLEIIKQAAEKVRSQYGAVGAGAYDIVSDAFGLFLQAIESLETEAEEELAALGDPRDEH